MKNRTLILTILLTLAGAVTLHARQFEHGEKLYINANQNHNEGDSKFNWASDGAHLFLYIWKAGVTGSEKWLTLTKESGDIYSAVIPADNWDKCIISSEPEFEHYFGRRADKKRKLYNGMIQCNLYQYFKGDRRK